MDNCRIGCTCSIECEEATTLAYAARRARARAASVQERALSGLRETHAQQTQVVDSLRGRVES